MNCLSVDAGFAGDVKVMLTASGRVKLTLGDGFVATYFDRTQAVSLMNGLQAALAVGDKLSLTSELVGRATSRASTSREIRRDVDAAQEAAESRESMY